MFVIRGWVVDLWFIIDDL